MIDTVRFIDGKQPEIGPQSGDDWLLVATRSVAVRRTGLINLLNLRLNLQDKHQAPSTHVEPSSRIKEIRQHCGCKLVDTNVRCLHDFTSRYGVDLTSFFDLKRFATKSGIRLPAEFNFLRRCIIRIASDTSLL